MLLHPNESIKSPKLSNFRQLNGNTILIPSKHTDFYSVVVNGCLKRPGSPTCANSPPAQSSLVYNTGAGRIFKRSLKCAARAESLFPRRAFA